MNVCIPSNRIGTYAPQSGGTTGGSGTWTITSTETSNVAQSIMYINAVDVQANHGSFTKLTINGTDFSGSVVDVTDKTKFMTTSTSPDTTTFSSAITAPSISLTGGVLTVTTLNATTGNIPTLATTTGTVTTLTSTTGNITTVNSTTIANSGTTTTGKLAVADSTTSSSSAVTPATVYAANATASAPIQVIIGQSNAAYKACMFQFIPGTNTAADTYANLGVINSTSAFTPTITMRNQYVGINNKTSPAANLDVNGTAIISGNTTIGGTPSLAIPPSYSYSTPPTLASTQLGYNVTTYLTSSTTDRTMTTTAQNIIQTNSGTGSTAANIAPGVYLVLGDIRFTLTNSSAGASVANGFIIQIQHGSTSYNATYVPFPALSASTTYTTGGSISAIVTITSAATIYLSARISSTASTSLTIVAQSSTASTKTASLSVTRIA